MPYIDALQQAQAGAMAFDRLLSQRLDETLTEYLSAADMAL